MSKSEAKEFKEALVQSFKKVGAKSQPLELSALSQLVIALQLDRIADALEKQNERYDEAIASWENEPAKGGDKSSCQD